MSELTPDEEKVQQSFEERFHANEAALIEEYLARFTSIDESGEQITIDTDRARELCPEYAADKDSRTRYSRSTYKTAKQIADKIFQHVLREIRDTTKEVHVLFTSGGSGSGKSTALSVNQERYDLIIDGTLSDLPSAKAKIHQLAKLGIHIKITIIHVYAPFEAAVERIVKRASAMGRVVTMDNLAVTHVDARSTFLKLQDRNKFPLAARIQFRIINSEFPRASMSVQQLPKPTVEELREVAFSCLDRLEKMDDYKDCTEMFRELRKPGSRYRPANDKE